MKKILSTAIFFAVTQGQLAFAMSIESWWQICGVSDANVDRAACLLSVDALESGVLAQASYSSVLRNEDQLSDQEAANLMGFCWNKAQKENLEQKLKSFKGYVASRVQLQDEVSSYIGMAFRDWYGKRYKSEGCRP